MIIELRKKLKSKMVRNIILWVILIVLSMGFLSAIFLKIFKLESKMGSGEFATVNGNEISLANFKMKMEESQQQVQMIRKYFGAEADKLIGQMEMFQDPKTSALNTVINQELLDQLAEKLNICLASDFVKSKLIDKNFLQSEFRLIDFDRIINPETQQLDPQGLSFYLRALGITGGVFEQMLINALKREILTEIIANSYYIPEFEARQKYIDENLGKKYSVLRFDFNSFVQEARKESIKKEDLKIFYDSENAKGKRYMMPEKRTGIAYYFDANNYGVSSSDDEIKKYYEDEKIKLFLKEPARVQVRRILLKGDSQKKALEIREKLIKNPERFDAIAKESSEDKETAKSGGLMPMVSRGKMDLEFDKAAFLLKNNGDISDVIKTKDGYEILKRENKQDAIYKTLAEVSGQIKDKITSKKFKEIFSSDMGRMLSKNEFDENKFNELSKKALKTENIELKSLSDDNITNALFRARENNPAYFVDLDKGVIVRLLKVYEKNTPELSSIESQVANDYYDKKASDMVASVIKKVAMEAKTKPINQLEGEYKNKYNVEYIDSGFVKEEDLNKSNLKTKGCPVDKISGLNVVGSTNFYRGSGEKSDGFVVKLDQTEKFDQKAYQDKKQQIVKGLIRDKKMAQIEEFIDFLRKKATIKISK